MDNPFLVTNPTSVTKTEGIGGPTEPIEDPAPNRTPEEAEEILYPIGDRWGTHPGRALSPMRLAEIFYAAEIGFPAMQCDLIEDLKEADGHLRSQSEARHDAIAGKDWQWQAGGDKPEDHTAASELQDALRFSANFDDMLEHQQTKLEYGYAPSRIRWRRIDGTWIPWWFDNIPHRRIIFDVNQRPRILTFDQPAIGEALKPGEWIFGRARHRVTTMAGIMRTAAWWTMFKRTTIIEWVQFCRRFGIPFRLGTYPDNMPKEEKAALKAAISALGNDQGAVFHERNKITIVEAKGGGAGSPQASLAGFCNQEISKLFTGATLTSGEGSSTGSYALGRVHEDRMFTLTLADARSLERLMQRQLATLFCAFNGIKCAPPKLKIHVVRDQDPQARIDVMSRAGNELGLELDEDQVRVEFQLKKPTGKALKGTLAANLKKIEPPQKTPRQTVD